MKKCPKCGKETEEDFVFCPSCGAEFVSDKKKLSFFERRQLKEAETKELMQKSFLSNEQVEGAKELDVAEIKLEHRQTLDSAYKAGIRRVIAAIILIIAALAWAFISINSDISKNIKLVIIFAVFISIFFCASVLLSDVNLINVLKKMKSSEFAVKKVKYGQPPLVNNKGELYNAYVEAKCADCFANMHIEEVEGVFVAVCNQNRTHVYKINFEAVHQKYFSDENKNSINT